MSGEWYEIRVEGRLPSGWSEWFGLELRWGAEGDTILSGYLADQPALHGVLAKIRDLNVKLIAVNRRTPPKEEAPRV